MAEPTPIIPKASDGAKASAENDNFKQLNDQLRSNIIKDETGTPRVILGYYPDGWGSGNDYGIKVSKEGQNVTTATDANLIMSSAFNMFKIVSTAEVVISVGTTAGTVYSETVAHGLGYRPMVLAQVRYDIGTDETQPFPFTISQYFGGAISIRAYGQIIVDDTNVKFQVIHDGIIGSTENFTVKYYILAETGVT